MEATALKAYDKYKAISAKPFTHVTTTQLNILYNIICRMNRDEEYKNAIIKLETEEGEPLDRLIEKYFSGYNNLYGLDIRNNLTEFLDPNFAEGTYFVITTEKDGKEISPIELVQNDVCHVKVKHFSHATDQATAVPILRGTAITDNGDTLTVEAANSDRIEFDLTLDRPGGIRFKVAAIGEDGKVILGSETAYGGVLFSIREIMPTHKAPEDLEQFWLGEIDRLLSVDPTDTVAEGYSGNVQYEFDMPSRNHFGITKVDEKYLEKLSERKIVTINPERLEQFDIYELYLKAPGPCHASAYVTIPKEAEPASLTAVMTYDGYSAHTPAPIFSQDRINMHCTHHGYDLCMPDEGYYNLLNGSGILGNYGRGNGKPNSDYRDIHDCYLLYTHLRNLQFIRFLTDKKFAGVIPGLHESFNGDIILGGGSMGGYQTVCMGGILTLFAKRVGGFTLKLMKPNIPAFCDLAARLGGRASTGLQCYEEGMDYFDAAILSSLARADISIGRVGLGDETCPHTGIIAMMNSLPKEYVATAGCLQNSNHGYIPDSEHQHWHEYCTKQ